MTLKNLFSFLTMFACVENFNRGRDSSVVSNFFGHEYFIHQQFSRPHFAPVSMNGSQK